MIAPSPPFSLLRTEIAGIPVADLARQFGTPTYVYDAAKIVERIDDLEAFDRIRYAQKACSNLAILDLVRRQGVLVDAVSAGEVAPGPGGRLQAATGDPPPIVYTADIFDREALDLVVEHGIHVNCGSPDMIDQLGERAPGGEITLRINPGFGHGHSQKTNTGGEQSKHGIWHEQLDDCLRRAAAARPDRHRPAHAHRLGDRPRAPLAGVRGDGARRPEVGPLDHDDQRRRRVADALPATGESYVDLDAYFQLVGRDAQAAGRRASATPCAWRSSRAVTWSPRAATW